MLSRGPAVGSRGTLRTIQDFQHPPPPLSLEKDVLEIPNPEMSRTGLAFLE
jgi:hypothetical protein